jgi:uncharacterized protein YecE (DUF72 family)
VPDGFRFSVKLPREITHRKPLMGAEELLDRFVAEALSLGEKLGPLLVQLPPKLGFAADVAGGFFAAFGTVTPARSSANRGTPAGSRPPRRSC